METSERSEAGQSLLEFALVLPILLVFLIAVLNFGEVLAADLMVQNITRNGARAASLGDSESQVVQQVTSDIQNNVFLSAVACASTNSQCPASNPTIQITPSPNASNSGNWTAQTQITVQVQYGLELWGPITPLILGNPYVFKTSVTMSAE